jgi:hypothetical protein
LRFCGSAALILLVVAGPAPLIAGNTTVSFEGLPDSTVVTTQYSGLTFANTIILSAGITLNEFEFPPHSGTNVASDNGGPITITFATPIQSFSGYFTYSVPLTIRAFGSTNNLVASAVSRFSSNEALSGVAGSQPNELIQVAFTGGITEIVITGSAAGTSFALDDLTASSYSPCDLQQTGNITAADVQLIINQALGIIPAVNDLNGDGVVNVVDVQIEINAALGLGCSAP